MENLKSLSEQILSDTSSGIQVDSRGRRYFKQRLVQFQTLGLTQEELHGPWIPGAGERLTPPDWGREPTYGELRQYASRASERFLLFWYRVFDVAIARGLSGRDREIFRNPITAPSSLIDIGLPEDPSLASCPPELAQKILQEYGEELHRKPGQNIFYITEYLRGCTTDIRQAMEPYHRFWDLERERRESLKNSGTTDRTMGPGPELGRILEEFVDASLMVSLRRAKEGTGIRRIVSDKIRRLIFELKRDGTPGPFTPTDREMLFGEPGLTVDPESVLVYSALRMPGALQKKLRSGAFHLSNRFRLILRVLRLKRNISSVSGGDSMPDGFLQRIRVHEQKYEEILNSFRNTASKPESREAIERTVLFFNYLEENLEGVKREPSTWIRNAIPILDGKSGRHPDTGKTKAPGESTFSPDSLPMFLVQQKTLDDRVLDHYRSFLSPGSNTTGDISPTGGPPNFSRLETFHLPEDLSPGDPFREWEATSLARAAMRKRLRPIRMAAGSYSTIADERHAAISLNPILRLWKDRPGYREKEIPSSIEGEFNTPASIQLLLRLATLVDPSLEERILFRRKALADGEGPAENLENALIFITPGSCFPLREVSRFDFPEFRGSVIGETRNPSELGVPAREESILTGGWYSKRNHSFYYPVGGDNGSLLYSIWKASRLQGPPAFFFALGQFVHDCLDDNLAYYRASEIPFRVIVEDYYRREDLTRKNRGEKTGRKKADNSRDGVRFMFAVAYSRFMTELLTGSPQSGFRHRPSENWFASHIGFTGIYGTAPERVREIRRSVLDLLEQDNPGVH